MSDRSRQRLRTLTIIIATALVIAPAAALAGHQFNDVPNSNIFHDDINWMKDNGVAKGCNPPANDEYCPDDNVTREQMAAFMHRLETENVFVRPGEDAVDGGNADTVDGMHASDFLGATEQAADSDKLDGKDATDFLGAGEQAADSDLLDGKNSTAFATAADLADLDAFMPVATFTVVDGSINRVNFRDPITGTPTISGANGLFHIGFPGFTFNIYSDAAVCTGLFEPYSFDLASHVSKGLRVTLYESDGTLADDVDSEDDFTCAVYEN